MNLSKPYIDCDNGPHAGKFVCQCVCNICHTLVSKNHVCPEMLRVFQYNDVFMLVMSSTLKHLPSHLLSKDWKYQLSAMKVVDKHR